LHRRGIDHGMGIGEVGGIVPDMHLDPHGAQTPDIGAFGGIAALNLVAQIVHDLGDAAHADAADADEMDGADAQRHAGGDPNRRRCGHQAGLLPASVSTTSANLSAACGVASAWARAARTTSSAGAVKILFSILAKASGV